MVGVATSLLVADIEYSESMAEKRRPVRCGCVAGAGRPRRREAGRRLSTGDGRSARACRPALAAAFTYKLKYCKLSVKVNHTYIMITPAQ